MQLQCRKCPLIEMSNAELLIGQQVELASVSLASESQS